MAMPGSNGRNHPEDEQILGARHSSPPIVISNQYWEIVSPQEPYINTANPQQLSLHAAAVCKGSLYLFGGYNGTSHINTLFCYSFIQQSWINPYRTELDTSGTDNMFPSARDRHCMTSLDNCLYLFGGDSGNNRLNDFYQYNVDTCQWRPLTRLSTQSSEKSFQISSSNGFNSSNPEIGSLPHDYSLSGSLDGGNADGWILSMPSPRYSAAMTSCTSNRCIYLFGGYDGEYRNDLWMYQVDTGTWSAVKTHLSSSHAGPLINRNLEDIDRRSTIHSTSQQNASFSEAQPVHTYLKSQIHSQTERNRRLSVPSPRYRASLVEYGQKLYLFGGHDGTKHLQDIYEFDVVLGTWSKVETTGKRPPARDSHTAVVHGRMMYVFGGSNGTALNDFYCFDIPLKQWSIVSVSSMVPLGRFCHIGVTFDDCFYIYGGYDGIRRLNDFHRFHFGHQNPESRLLNVPKSNLKSDLLNLFEKGSLVDCVFILKDEEKILAHKIICARCPYFRYLFSYRGKQMSEESMESAPENESHGSVLVSSEEQRVKFDFSWVESEFKAEAGSDGLRFSQIPFAVFETFVRFLYTFDSDVLFYDAENQKNIDENGYIFTLFRMAKQYKVKVLKSICFRALVTEISVETVVDMLQQAELFKLFKLKSKCMDFIVSSFNEIASTRSFEELGRKNIDLFFSILRERNAQSYLSPASLPNTATNPDSIHLSSWNIVNTSKKYFKSDDPIPERSLHASCCYKHYMYVFGGYNGKSRLTAFDRFNFRTLRWEQVAMKAIGFESNNANMQNGQDYTNQANQRSLSIESSESGSPEAGNRSSDFHEINENSVPLQEEPPNFSTLPGMLEQGISSRHIPDVRDRHSMVVISNFLYLFGGYSEAKRTNKLYIYDLVNEVWKLEGVQHDTPSPRHSHAACSHKSSMWIFGGYDGFYLNDLHEFDTHTKLWSTLSFPNCREDELPRERYRSSLVSDPSSDIMYLFGGHDGTTHLNDVHAYNPRLRNWVTIRTSGKAPVPRDSHTAVVYDNKMFIFGGSSGHGGFPMNDVCCLNLSTFTWCIVQNDRMVPTPRFCHTAQVFHGSLYIFGGYSGVSRMSDIVYVDLSSSSCCEHHSESAADTDLEPFVDFSTYSDVMFQIDNRKVHSHKFILLRSPYFEAMFERSQMLESRENIIHLSDINYDSFLDFLRYLYTDRIIFKQSAFYRSAEEVANESFETCSRIINLYGLADRFDVKRLETLCENELYGLVDVETCGMILYAAHAQNSLKLKTSCMQYIIQNFDRVSKTLSFQTMARMNVELLLQILNER